MSHPTIKSVLLAIKAEKHPQTLDIGIKHGAKEPVFALSETFEKSALRAVLDKYCKRASEIRISEKDGAQYLVMASDVASQLKANLRANRSILPRHREH